MTSLVSASVVRWCNLPPFIWCEKGLIISLEVGSSDLCLNEGVELWTFLRPQGIMAHAIHIFLLLSHGNHGLDAIAAWLVCVWCHCTIFNPVWIFWSLYKPLLNWMLSKSSQVWRQCWGNNRTDTDWDSKYDVITDRIKDGHRKKKKCFNWRFCACVLVIIFVDVFCSTLSVSDRPLFTTGLDHSWLYTECSSQISLISWLS